MQKCCRLSYTHEVSHKAEGRRFSFSITVREELRQRKSQLISKIRPKSNPKPLVPEPIKSHCASHSIRKYSPLQHQEGQDILAHRLQISATISRLKVLCLRVWISSHQSFVWSKVFPLDQWKSKKLTEREEFSDDEETDKEDEGHKEDEVGEFEVPLKKIEAQKAPQKRLCIPKKMNSGEECSSHKVKAETASGTAFETPPPTKRRRKLEAKSSRICSKQL